MRYPASEKLEIMRLVEQSHLPVKRTLEKLGIARATFYRWSDLYQSGGPEALDTARPGRIGSGTASRTLSASGSRTWRSTSRHSRLGSLPCALPIPKATLCQKLRSTAC